MRVLHLLPPATERGRIAPYSFLQEEIEALAEAGVEVHIISTELEAERQIGGIRMVPLPPGATLAERSRTLRFLAAHANALPRGLLRDPRRCYHNVRIERFATDLVEGRRIDLIHSHFGYPAGFGGMLVRRATGAPLIATFRGMDVLVDPSIGYGLRLERAYDLALRALLREADRSTFWSEYTRQAALDLGAPARNTVVIRKGVDLERFAPAAERLRLRAELGLQTPMILTVAGLIKRKGIDTILQALGTIRDSYEFTLLVAGEGPEEDALAALSRQLQLGDRVRFLGRIGRAEIPRYFAACDIFVLASRLEASGNALFEAMASGRPVICTDSGGPPEYVREGRTGFVVPVADPDRMAQQIAVLLANPAYADELGREGRRVAEQELAYGRMTGAFLDLYRSLLAAPRPTRQRSRGARAVASLSARRS